MTEQMLRDSMAETMRSWLGLREADGSHRLILELYNSHRPLARGHRLAPYEPWCAAAVSAGAMVSGLTRIIPVECSCGRMLEGFRALEAWTERDDVVPRTGDVIFYDWDDTGYGDDRGAPDHVGVVETADSSRLTVIEGNRDDAVSRRVLARNGRSIRGFGTPDYAGEAALRSVDELALLGLLRAPAHWRRLLLTGQVPHLGLLMSKAVRAVRREQNAPMSAEEGLSALVRAGVIDSPDYWTAAMARYGELRTLMQDLGSAVRD